MTVPASACRLARSDAALAGGPGGTGRLRELVATALDGLDAGVAARDGPVPAGEPGRVADTVAAALAGGVLPAAGVGARAALGALARVLAEGAADPSDPACAAHLHCPPLAVAVAADLVVSTLNPSMDSWDQAPAATVLEAEVVAALAGLVGFDPQRAGGTLTSGGTASNLMGLLLARDRAGPGASGGAGARVYCSAQAHFSVWRSASLLGAGEDAVRTVPCDAAGRMDPDALARLLASEPPGRPATVVATAGTTDFGAVDRLRPLADVSRRYGAWLHVDAAYGGGALFSDRLAGLLDGLELADSVALDLHKLGWQPVAAGVFLTRDAAAYRPLSRTVAYLNPADDEAAGYVSLLGRSLRTTRRPDVFKLAVTFRALGRSGLGALVDTCHDLARYAAARIDAHPRLELAGPPVLTTVVFRYAAPTDPDGVNARLRRRLLAAGTAVVGRTEVGPERAVHLKLTLLNPAATRADVDALVAAVVAAGAVEEDAG